MNQVIAQAPERKKKIPLPGKQNSASIGINIPIGDFSLTHFGGISIEYFRSNHRFGKWQTVPSKKTGFLVNGGLAYYFGKKETVSGYSYKYPGYSFLNIYPGLLYNLSKKVNLSLSAGPAISLYNGSVQFNFGANLQGSYNLNNKLAISPALSWMKESGADLIGAGSLKASFFF